MTESNQEVIQYAPYFTFVHPSFWHTLTDVKLNVDKLEETNKQIFGKYSFRDDVGPVFEVDGTSFNKKPQHEQYFITMTGNIINKNTVEEFRDIDKAALINTVGRNTWSKIKENIWIHDPSILLKFFILSFADLKKFHYYYWFAFPAPSQPIIQMTEKSKLISSEYNKDQLKILRDQHKALEEKHKAYFFVTKSMQIKKLSDVLVENKLDLENIFLGFVDPSNSDNPGWTLRLFLTALLYHIPSLSGKVVKIIGLRFSLSNSIDNSRVFSVQLPSNVPDMDSVGWVGWERNDKGNLGPKLANMSASMDPIKLADTSSDLNIKLMKWRLAPDLDINIMKDTKCLLLGAGTLGCHVARNLLAWGFRHITFVDYGKVSYSNPTRQVLFTFQDCLGGGKKKAEAAADGLKAILPTVNTKGIPLHIPMPGHPIGKSLEEETISNIKTLEEEIKSHDVVFLLLDTREARWMPTLLAAHHGKIVINAALGFDSYLVMRHGTNCGEATESLTSEYVTGGHLGCYFCNDVTAPGNSLKDRTLDQQCTVTRPGVATIAGALAVEILVGILQHPLRIQAPAPYNIAEVSTHSTLTQGVLGPIPHTIRGFLHSYQTVTPTCPKFKQCVACSEVVINKYREDGIKFLMDVCDSGKYLEDVTGLSNLHLAAEMTEILTFSDEDAEDMTE